MDISLVLDTLNKSQREAVVTPPGNMLVLAGAGSGKTRVLVHRIARYIETKQSSPFGIMAVTFTNKAATEMRSRIETLLDAPVGGMWVGTFHGLTHRILRAHWQEAGLPHNFTILDSDDQYRSIRRLLRSMEIDESNCPPREVQWFINARKDDGLRSQHIDDNDDPILHQMIRIYQGYEDFCNRSGVVDFAELLLRAHELFRDQKNILSQYRDRFRFVLVDEFQDTNALQYAWLRLLIGDQGSLFAVGDDDQSIYSWRGARVENMQQFKHDFANPSLIKLEQNYRSTANILHAANALIKNNKARLGKELWTDNDSGEKISLYNAYNEHDEARYVIEQIVNWHSQTDHYLDNAVLYRVSAQSRIIEEGLMRANIPYRVYGGMRFYERAEIKDALAYVRLATFQEEDVSFERIVNTPTRGIGQRTIEALRSISRQEKCSLWQAAQNILSNKSLSPRALNALEGFINLITQMNSKQELPLSKVVDNVIKASGLIDHYRKEKGERGLARIENMEELVNVAGEFNPDAEELQEMQPLQAFLAHAALESGATQAGEYSDCVNLMTLHSAKGLEFANVYLIGMEEGLFPHQRSMEDLTQLEEERRLCYVGITRAKKSLMMVYTQHRRLYGQDYYPRPSRFIDELPEELVQEIRMNGSVIDPRFAGSRANSPSNGLDTSGGVYTLGQRVSHVRFGEGVILNLEGSGGSTRMQVNFVNAGSKWLVAEYANLKSI